MLSPRKAPSRPSWLWTSRAYPFLEIVVVGTGDRTERLQPHVLRAMRQRGIAVEVQDTVRPGLGIVEGSPGRALARLTLAFSLQPNACATFNFLCHEGRVTGAALIPPPGGTALTSQAQAAE